MKTFSSHINGSTPVVVDFFAEWCGPCKMMPPILKEVKSQVGDKATILKIDVDKTPQLSQMYMIQAVPTLIIFKNGNVIWRKSGVATANEILEHLKQHITQPVSQ